MFKIVDRLFGLIGSAGIAILNRLSSDDSGLSDDRHALSEAMDHGDMATVQTILSKNSVASYPFAVTWYALCERILGGDEEAICKVLADNPPGTFKHAEKWLDLEAAMRKNDIARARKLLRNEQSPLFEKARTWLVNRDLERAMDADDELKVENLLQGRPADEHVTARTYLVLKSAMMTGNKDVVRDVLGTCGPQEFLGAREWLAKFGG